MVALVPMRLEASRPDAGCDTRATPGPPGKQAKENMCAVNHGSQFDLDTAERSRQYNVWDIKVVVGIRGQQAAVTTLCPLLNGNNSDSDSDHNELPTWPGEVQPHELAKLAPKRQGVLAKHHGVAACMRRPLPFQERAPWSALCLDCCRSANNRPREARE